MVSRAEKDSQSCVTSAHNFHRRFYQFSKTPIELYLVYLVRRQLLRRCVTPLKDMVMNKIRRLAPFSHLTVFHVPLFPGSVQSKARQRQQLRGLRRARRTHENHGLWQELSVWIDRSLLTGSPTNKKIKINLPFLCPALCYPI